MISSSVREKLSFFCYFLLRWRRCKLALFYEVIWDKLVVICYLSIRFDGPSNRIIWNIEAGDFRLFLDSRIFVVLRQACIWIWNITCPTNNIRIARWSAFICRVRSKIWRQIRRAYFRRWSNCWRRKSLRVWDYHRRCISMDTSASCSWILKWLIVSFHRRWIVNLWSKLLFWRNAVNLWEGMCCLRYRRYVKATLKFRLVHVVHHMTES